MKSGRAVFLDRDGVINQLVYYPEHGIVDSPFTLRQFNLVEGAAKSLKEIRDIGYLLIVVSNQPGIAKAHFSKRTLEGMGEKMKRELAKEHVTLDGEYYCLHHPEALKKEYRLNCGCRKPEPGLILRGATEHGIDLRKSFMVGDGIVDVQAGNRAGCRTILVANVNSLLLKIMRDSKAEPDFIARNLGEALQILKNG